MIIGSRYLYIRKLITSLKRKKLNNLMSKKKKYVIGWYVM